MGFQTHTAPASLPAPGLSLPLQPITAFSGVSARKAQLENWAASAPASAASERPTLVRAASSTTNLLPLVEPLSPFAASFHTSTPVAEWTIEDVREWLGSLNCEAYYADFADNDIDGEVLLDLGRPELRHLVHRVGDRIKIQQAIRRLQKQAADRAAAAAGTIPVGAGASSASNPTPTDARPSPQSGYFGGADPHAAEKIDGPSLRFLYSDGKTRVVPVVGGQTAEEIKLSALRKLFPAISEPALINWQVLRDGAPLADAQLVEIARNPPPRLTLALEARAPPARASAPVARSAGTASRLRPTSQHVSAHLSEFFPGVDSGELERTVRNSMLVSRRLSTVGGQRYSQRTSNMMIPETIWEPPSASARSSMIDGFAGAAGAPTGAPQPRQPIPSRVTSRHFGANRRFSTLNMRSTPPVPEQGETADLSFQGLPPPPSSVPPPPPPPPPPPDESSLDDRQFMDKLTSEEISPTRWIRGQVIGSGTFGTVYMAMNAFNGELLAVKQVELPTGAGVDEHRNKRMVEALRREVTLLRDFDHENIVQYRGFKSEDNMLNIFLEYVPGGSLASMLSQYGSFEENLVRRHVRQILAGLVYLHERQVIHRDIKGANILVTNMGQIKISDFGLSKKIETQQLLNQRQSMQGSAFWMAPEVVKQVGTTAKADIWSLGCLVIELITGTHPFPELTQMQAIFKLGNSVRPAVPTTASAPLQNFLTRTLEIDSATRPSAEELRHHPFILASS